MSMAGSATKISMLCQKVLTKGAQALVDGLRLLQPLPAGLRPAQPDQSGSKRLQQQHHVAIHTAFSLAACQVDQL